MTVLGRVQSDVKEAMKARDRQRLAALRLIVSELQKAQKEGGADELAVLRRERKRRLESAAAYAGAGREDLAAKERFEAALIEEYLPAQLSEEELRAIVAEAVIASGAKSMKEIGIAMKAAIAAVGGRAEGAAVSAVVKEILSA